MKVTGILSVLAMLAGFSGCYTATLLEYDALKPADVNIPQSVRSLVVIDRCDLDSTFKATAYSMGRTADFNRDSVLSKLAVLGCSDALLESPRFSLFIPSLHRSLIGEDLDANIRIPWKTILSTMGDTLRDAVLSFEAGSFDDTLKYTLVDGWIGVYQYEVKVTSFWRLYRISDFQSVDYRFVDTIGFDVENPAEFISSAAQRMECIKSAIYTVGANTARRIAPWWTGVQRNFFSYGPKAFTTAASRLRLGNWKDAAEILRPYTESKHKLQSAIACFNMAVACEMANTVDVALEWLNKSEKLGMEPYYILEYKPKLIRRKTELDQLDRQLK